MGGLKHTDVGQRLTKTEWEATTSHEIASASTGDILYHDGTGIVALAIGSSGQGLTVSTAGIPAWDDITGAVTYDAPGAISPDDAISSGTATTVSRSDHVHGIAAGTAGTIGPQVTAAEGTSTGFARADHAHGSNSLAPTAIAPDATNAEGASTAFARATHTHGITAAAPLTISVVTAANEGNSTSFARANHIHGLNHAITNNHLVTIDGTTNQPVNTDYAKFTALGLEGKTAAQIWADLSGTAAAAVDMNGQFFSDIPVEQGATVPVSPRTGEMFLHTPTGRNVLMIYDGSAWIPIISLGTMAIYVDKTDGTDAMDKGTAVDAAAVATIAYALSLVPGLFGGNVVIYINNETYAETVTIQGKTPTGPYTLTLQGTLNSQETGTASGMTQGTAAIQGILTDTGNPFNGDTYTDMLLHVATLDEYRVIDGMLWTLGYDSGSTEPGVGDIISGQTSLAWGTIVAVNHVSGTWGGGDDAGTLTVHVTWDAFDNNELIDNETDSAANVLTVDTGAGDAQDDNQLIIAGIFSGAGAYDWTVYDWGTTITKVAIAAGQVGVVLNGIYWNNASAVDAVLSGAASSVTLNQCKTYGEIGASLANIVANYCLIWRIVGTAALKPQGNSSVRMAKCKFISQSNTGTGAQPIEGSRFVIQNSVFDGAVPGWGAKATAGVNPQSNAAATLWGNAGTGYNRIRNYDTGILASAGGVAYLTSTVVFSNNTADKNPAAASDPAYID